MTSDARIVRRDSVQFYPDRAGRLPNFVWVQQRGFLVLTEVGDQRSVVLVRDSRPPLEVDLATVRHVGTPRGPFGSGSLGDRALRLAVGEERIIVAFTGETTDMTDSITDLNMGRLRGDVDLVSGLSAVHALWRNRDFWSRSLQAANAWRELLGGDVRSTKSRGAAPRHASRGGAGIGARYTGEFRQQAVATARGTDKSVARVARELQISPTTLRRWMRQSPSVDGSPER